MILRREVYRGNVRWTFPHRSSASGTSARHLLRPSNQGKAMRRGPDGYLKRWVTDAPPFDTAWEQTATCCGSSAPGERTAIWVFWDSDRNQSAGT